MKVLQKSIVVASVAALGLSLAACKKDTATEQQVDEASEAGDAKAGALDASGSASDTMVAPVGPSGGAKAGQAEDKARM